MFVVETKIARSWMTLTHKNGRMHTDDTKSGRIRDQYETGENIFLKKIKKIK